jgi:hypothetical protein
MEANLVEYRSKVAAMDDAPANDAPPPGPVPNVNKDDDTDDSDEGDSSSANDSDEDGGAEGPPSRYKTPIKARVQKQPYTFLAHDSEERAARDYDKACDEIV